MSKRLKETTLTMVGGYLIGLVMILVFIYSYEYTSPRSWWFNYETVNPLKESFTEGEELVFWSQVKYHRDLTVAWEDTLFCNQDGRIKKYQTQYWPKDRVGQQKSAGEVANIPLGEVLETWAYTADTPDPTATSCWLESVIIGYTPHGYKKVQVIAGSSFEVNK